MLRAAKEQGVMPTPPRTPTPKELEESRQWQDEAYKVVVPLCEKARARARKTNYMVGSDDPLISERDYIISLVIAGAPLTCRQQAVYGVTVPYIVNSSIHYS
jgi:hypothetical protein